MVGWILKKILGSKNQRELRRLAPIVRRVNEFDEQFKSLSDDALRAKTAAWKEELTKISDPEEQWNRLDEILPEVFAVVKNAARRMTERQPLPRGGDPDEVAQAYLYLMRQSYWVLLHIFALVCVPSPSG